MNRPHTAILALIIPCLLLTSCGKEKEDTTTEVSGAKSAISIMHLLTNHVFTFTRPSAAIGIFSGIYTSQGIVLPVDTARLGFESIMNILKGHSQANTDENFAILREIGDVLQVDIVDLLNRSNNRIQTIDDYTQSLRNTGILTERKINELTATYENLTIKRKEERTISRDLERSLRTALKDQDYSEASTYEEDLAKANANLAETETKEKQAKDMIDRMEGLYEITGDRLQAIENNREILIAGLRVINVPGIADFNILEKGKSWKKRGAEDIFGTSR